MKKKLDYEVGSGNVFADLGLPNPEERLAKAEVAFQINTLIEQKKLTQTAAAKLLGIDQPKISALSKGKLSGFSLERLLNFLTILGKDVSINITNKARSKKKASITINAPRIKKAPILKRPTASNSLAIHAKKKTK